MQGKRTRRRHDGALHHASRLVGRRLNREWSPRASDPRRLTSYANLPVPDLGLRPLLATRDGKPITRKADWESARQELHKIWFAQLGKAPDKPEGYLPVGPLPASLAAEHENLIEAPVVLATKRAPARLRP